MVGEVVVAPHRRLLHLRLVHLRLLHLRLPHLGMVLAVLRRLMQPVFCNAACGIAGRALS